MTQGHLLPEEDLAVVKEIYRALERGELLRVIAHLDDHIEWTETSAGAARHVGAVSVLRDALIPVANHWKLEPLDFSQVDGVILVRGKALAAGGVSQPEAHFAHRWFFEAGRVRHVSASVGFGSRATDSQTRG